MQNYLARYDLSAYNQPGAAGILIFAKEVEVEFPAEDDASAIKKAHEKESQLAEGLTNPRIHLKRLVEVRDVQFSGEEIPF